jgi:hypothetical protein
MDGFIWKIGDYFHHLIGARQTLIVFFLLYMLSILKGWILLAKMLGQDKWFVIFCLTSLPSLFALARMNSISLVFPIFVLYLEAILSKNQKRQIWLIGLLVIFKPQLGVLIAVDFVHKKYKVFFFKILITILSLFLSIGTLSGFRPSTYFDYGNSVVKFGSSTGSLEYFYPQSVSIAHTVARLYDILGFFVFEKSFFRNTVIILLILLIVICLGRVSKTPILLVFFLLFIALFGLSKLTPPYYLMIMNAVVAVIINSHDEVKSKISLLFGFILSSSLLLIPQLNKGSMIVFFTSLGDKQQMLVANMTGIIAISFYLLFFLRNFVSETTETLGLK